MHKSNPFDLGEVHTLAAKALAHGADRDAINHLNWDISAGCSSPRELERYARPPATDGRYTTVVPGQTKVPFGVTLMVPCRKCDRCLRVRRWEWHHRAMAELCASPRSWFGTLTLRPGARLWFLNQARLGCIQQGEDYETYTAEQQFGKLCRCVGKELNLWLARVRKHARAPFRYLLVFERHKDGHPHMHCLLHETVDGSTSERMLRTSWRGGHSKFVVIDNNQPATAGYVAKYLAKSNLARVRASLRYGKNTPSGHSPQGPTWRDVSAPTSPGVADQQIPIPGDCP